MPQVQRFPNTTYAEVYLNPRPSAKPGVAVTDATTGAQ